MAAPRLKVLVLAPYLNGDGLGEVYSIFKWIEALCDVADVTVLSVTRAHVPLADHLPDARVIRFIEPDFLGARLTRLNAMAKPYLPVFFRKARAWIKSEIAKGAHFDIAHQILPQAMRYASPLAGLRLPYVIGPLGGSLTTPAAFASEIAGGGIYTRLRGIDRPRLAYDPWLRRGYREAGLILGVAPYINYTLHTAGITPRRFVPVLERGHPGTLPQITRHADVGRLQLLHVGRVIRTKGLRDVIRALAHLRDLPGVTLVSAGDGEDLAACKREAADLGLENRVTFLGRVPRTAVDTLYEQSDVFAFPSFREPMGGVFFEAMEYGLPVIAAARGGPDFIIDDTCGIRLPVETPDQFATAIAGAIRDLAQDPARRLRLGEGAQTRLQSFGDWPQKARDLVALYHETIAAER